MAGRRSRTGWIVTACLLAVAGTLWAALTLLASKETLLWPTAGPQLIQAAGRLNSTDIDAVFDPVTRSLAVTQTLTLTNRAGVALREVVLRAYPNAFRSEDYSPAATDELFDLCYPEGFSAGSLSFTSIRVRMAQGAEQSPGYAYLDDAQTVLSVSLPENWAAGETLTLRAVYTVQIPQAAYRFGENGGVWALGNVFLIPSPFAQGEYRTPELVSIGDPFVSECANYTVRLTLPEGYTVAATGVPRAESVQAATRTVTLEAPAVRDFALCLSRDYRLAEGMQDGVRVRACGLNEEHARALLRYGMQALACYNARYGAYPYPAFTLCEATFPLDGMEYPMLAMIAADRLNAGGEALEQLVARQTAHQWWTAVVGSDGFYQAWQDEALCGFSLLDYWETRYGPDARDALQYAQVETSMRVTVPEGVTPGSPVDYFGDLPEYRLIVYSRGTAAICALNTALNGGLDGFLADYYRRYAFSLATRQDFEACLAAYTGEDWSPLLSDYLDTYLNN